MPLFLTIIGLGLIFFEFFVPGSLLAIMGGVCIVGGITTFSLLAVPFIYKILFFIAVPGCMALLCKLALTIIKKKNVYLADSQEGFSASSFDASFIGLVGEVLTDLKPSGHIEINGKRIQAVSESLYIPKGSSIIVEGGRGAYLIVKEKKS